LSAGCLRLSPPSTSCPELRIRAAILHQVAGCLREHDGLQYDIASPYKSEAFVAPFSKGLCDPTSNDPSAIVNVHPDLLLLVAIRTTQRFSATAPDPRGCLGPTLAHASSLNMAAACNLPASADYCL
jgi:hypothetical protein